MNTQNLTHAEQVAIKTFLKLTKDLSGLATDLSGMISNPITLYFLANSTARGSPT